MLQKLRKKETKKDELNHYVNKKHFLGLMISYRESVQSSKDTGSQKPRIPDEIGQVILDIATGLASKYNFSNYPFKEELIGDAVENCLRYIDNFDPAKSNNPFGYFTQITKFAFYRRIDSEKSVLYTKYKILEQNSINDLSDVNNLYITHNEENELQRQEFMDNFEKRLEKKKKSVQKTDKKVTVSLFGIFI